MAIPERQPKSKWAVLQLIRAQSGIVNWYPITTFFPRGSIADDPSLDGMDFVQQFIAEGLVEEHVGDASARTFAITARGEQQLSRVKET